jgi:DNA-binding IclR family transcriptional regulator
MRTNSSLLKGLHLLEHLAQAPHGLKCADLSRIIECPSSNTSIFLNTLIELGYVIKDGRDGRYYLSGKIKELGQHQNISLIDELKGLAETEMRRLHELYDENVILSILSRHHLSSIVEFPSTKALRIVNRSEDLFIPHVTAAGKAMLAFIGPKKLEAYLKQADFPRLTQQSINTLEQLKDELNQIKTRGWAINHGEYNELIYGIAAPILLEGEAIAAIVVQYPAFRHDSSQLEAYSEEVMLAAQKISKSFLHRTTPKPTIS